MKFTKNPRQLPKQLQESVSREVVPLDPHILLLLLMWLAPQFQKLISYLNRVHPHFSVNQLLRP
jgi:hypothetical protein